MATYNGYISQTIFNNQTVSGKNTTILNFLNIPIKWFTFGYVPSDLINTTLGQLVNNPNFKITSLSYKIDIRGQQYYNNSSTPTTDVNITLPSSIIKASYQANAPGNLGTGTYNVSEIMTTNEGYSSGFIANQIETNVYNKCYQGLPGCISYQASNYTLILTLNISGTYTGQNTPQSTGQSTLTYPGITDSNGQSINPDSHVIVHHVMY